MTSRRPSRAPIRIGENGAFADARSHTVVPGRGPNQATIGTGTNAMPTETAPPIIQKKIAARATPGPVQPSVPIINAEATVRSLGGRAHFCYQQGLARNENQQGRVTLQIVVGPGGDVQNVVATPSGIDQGVAECIASGARNLHFAPDAARGRATILTSFLLMKPQS